MKIKDGFILSEIADEALLVPTKGAFNGIVRINDTAKFIIECLREETTKENIIDKLSKEYDAKRDELEKSVDITFEVLKKIGALEA